MNNTNIEINKKEVLRYMGARGTFEPSIVAMVDKYILESGGYLAPRYVLRQFDIVRENGRMFIDTVNLDGNDIADFLKDSGKCYLMCATIGYEIEREIDKAATKSTLIELIIESIGSAAVENLCDKVQESIGKNLARFSPGYGDFTLDIQPAIIKLLNATKLIGVSVSDMMLLTPRKSVTAIIAHNKSCKLNKCKACDKECAFRK